MLFTMCFALAYADHEGHRQVIEVEADPSLVEEVRENPQAAAEAIAERDAALEAAMSEVRRLRVQNSALQKPEQKPKAPDAKSERELAVEAAAIEQSLREQGLPEQIPSGLARMLLQDEQMQPQAPMQSAPPSNPCMGFAWVFASLNDPNGYGPMGAIRCFVEKSHKSLLVENRTTQYGYALLLNGLLVTVHNHGLPQMAFTSEVPDVLARAMQRAGVSSVPIVPPMSRAYISLPTLAGNWQFIRYEQDPVTGGFDLAEVCRLEEYDTANHRGAWDLILGAHRNDCDP